MARDGTNRGGRRVRAGTKPEPSAYLAAQQRDGTQLRADEIYGCCDRVPVCGGLVRFPIIILNPPFGPLRAFANAAGARLCLLTPFLHLMQICIGCKIVSRETFCETTSLSGSVGH